MHVMELLKAGTDVQGDTFTPECVADVVKKFKNHVPVTIGFDPMALPVGRITSLVLEGDAIFAHVWLDADGEKAVADGMELASGGRVNLGKNHTHGDPINVEAFDLTGAALTDKKVK